MTCSAAEHAVWVTSVAWTGRARYAMRALQIVAASTALTIAAVAAAAEQYPSRPIRMIVPFAPGGGTDIIARLIGQGFTDSWGQTVVVDNRTGGGGIVGVSLVAKGIADGYTMLLASNGPLTYLPALTAKLPYDPERDLQPISLAATQPFVVMASNALGAQSMKDLIALAKAQPGKINYASGGPGGASHLGTELLKMLAAISLTHVPYKGTGPGLTAVLAGEVQLVLVGISSVIPHVKSGRARALAVTGMKRNPALPDVPTVHEAGVTGYEFDVWYGVLCPAGTPRELVIRASNEIARLAKLPVIRERFSAGGMEALANSPEEFAALIKRDAAKWRKVVTAANIKVE
jgi:tripartite-type tricarboxylate transporter receptor subunit TctC